MMRLGDDRGKQKNAFPTQKEIEPKREKRRKGGVCSLRDEKEGGINRERGDFTGFRGW